MSWATASAWIEQANNVIDGIVWGPHVLLPLLVGVGVHLGVQTRFVQFTRFGRMLRETAAKIFPRNLAAEGDLTPFQALTVATGGTVGVGNIAGVATAIGLGGPGAVFWMWISGLLGMGRSLRRCSLASTIASGRLAAPCSAGR